MICQLLQEYEVETQTELVELLRSKNVETTQTTVSRDMKELQLVKIPGITKNYRYSVPKLKEVSEDKQGLALFQHVLVEIDQMEKFVVLTTIPGSAPALGQLLEEMYEDLLFTLMVNDQRILMITFTEKQAKWLKRKLLGQLS